MLAGCGAANNAPDTGTSPAANAGDTAKIYDGVKLVYWSCWEATEPQGIVLKAAIEDFMEKTGCEVDVQFKGRKGIKEGLIPALDADQQIDLFDGMSDKSNYGDRIISLEDIVAKEDYEKDSNPTLMALCRKYHGGELKEVPYQMKANMYLYNKTLFKQAGIEAVPTNWAEFLDVCQKLLDAGSA